MLVRAHIGREAQEAPHWSNGTGEVLGWPPGEPSVMGAGKPLLVQGSRPQAGLVLRGT